MSVETPPESQTTGQPETLPALRREALLPSERSRGLGTVAVVCTMAGVASGLALATTLMAMQVADSMTVRTCPYRVVATDVQMVDVRPEHGYLGIHYTFRNGTAEVKDVIPGTPASAIQLRRGDHVLSVDGAPIRSNNELTERIFNMQPGTEPTIVVEREGQTFSVHPTLAPWPITY